MKDIKKVGTIEVPVDYLTDKDYQDKTVEKIERNKEIANRHILHMEFGKFGGLSKDQKCLLQPTDPNFELPSKEIVKIVVDLLISRGMTKNQISEAVGVSVTGSNRLLNYWINPESDRTINKSNWIVMAQLAGLMLVTMVDNENK